MPVTHETLVVDVGGGSSEFCIVDAVRPPRAAGLQARVGAPDRSLRDARSADTVASSRRCGPRRAEAIGERPGRPPTEVVAVGGTASNLVKMLPDADRSTGC